MSSETYSASLTPDPWLRIIVITSGRLLAAAGLVTVLTLDIGAAVRAAGCISWIILCRIELQQMQRGFDSCRIVRVFADGQIALLGNDKDWVPGTLQSGSIVLRKFAWLRVQTIDGEHIAEPLRGSTRENQEWRRLQVIWRHVGAGG